MIKSIKEFTTIKTAVNDEKGTTLHEVTKSCESELEIDVELSEKALKDIINGLTWQFDETRGSKKFRVRIAKEGMIL